MTTQISAMLADRLVEKLTADLVEANIVEAEKVGIVRGGSLQDNPLKYRIYVLVHCGMDPDDANWKDISLAYQEQQPERRQFFAPAYEVGGGSTWWRRGTIEWGYYGTKAKTTRDESRDIAFAISGKIERGISLCSIAGLVDDFGEVAVMLQPVWSAPDSGGGPPASFIWRGRVGYQCLTERPF